MPIKISINVSKIDKAELYEGKNGKYLNLVLWETPDSKYGDDYRVNQDVSKESRDAGKKGEILGNGRNFGTKKQEPPARKQTPPLQRKPPADPDLDAADQDVPF